MDEGGHNGEIKNQVNRGKEDGGKAGEMGETAKINNHLRVSMEI